ncbi:hypothetical protein [Flammeovirga aprica]|uniref:Uncharacterized protein n=1 Tax=Flammeovirga aprica JL-4 TaxID=694437 RepID=A0A7X9RTE7_9BACT|nr:hypothetical protein [Flammeovirga aprica]NME67219.1 hypothetical protein [Flammeovirga aprica JL-4]
MTTAFLNDKVRVELDGGFEQRLREYEARGIAALQFQLPMIGFVALFDHPNEGDKKSKFWRAHNELINYLDQLEIAALKNPEDSKASKELKYDMTFIQDDVKYILDLLEQVDPRSFKAILKDVHKCVKRFDIDPFFSDQSNYDDVCYQKGEMYKYQTCLAFLISAYDVLYEGVIDQYGQKRLTTYYNRKAHNKAVACMRYAFKDTKTDINGTAVEIVRLYVHARGN